MGAKAIAMVFLLAFSLSAQTSSRSLDSAEVDQTIEGLRQVSKELAETVKRFNSHLDEAASKFDRGYRDAGGKRVQGADADLNTPADIVEAAVRRGMAFRMLASRNDRYQPAALADLDRIQALIAEARKRVEDSTPALRSLLLVSARDFDPRRDAETKNRHIQLLKARAAAAQTADAAFSALPVEAPEPDAPDVVGLPQFDPGLSMRNSKTGAVSRDAIPAESAPARKTEVPIHIEHRSRVTLVKDAWCRFALTDSGIENENGLHLFYEEEWVQRANVVIRRRWRVAVDTSTGQHILVRRYPAIEMRGFLSELYEPIGRDHLWYMEPTAGSDAPSEDQLNEAFRNLSDARGSIEHAVSNFHVTIRDLLARHDRQRTNAGEYPLDAGLPASLREYLFAARADLSKFSVVVDSEKNVWAAIETARRSVNALEPLAAWANYRPDAEWERLLQRSDQEIGLEYAAETVAAQALPPDLSKPEAQFPALDRNLIVRIRRLPVRNPADGTIRCLQEIWLMESPMPVSPKVRRTATLIMLDSKTGDQSLVGAKTVYYPAAQGEVLEQVFDENAADDVLRIDRS